MAESIMLNLVTPERSLVSGEVQEIVAQAALGQVGILPGHANYITLMEPGEMTYKDTDGSVHHLAVSGGFAEVTLEEGVRIMAESAEFAEEIDLERAKAAKERAERRISDFDPSSQEVDITRAEAALQRSLARLSVIERAI